MRALIFFFFAAFLADPVPAWPDQGLVDCVSLNLALGRSEGSVSPSQISALKSVMQHEAQFATALLADLPRGDAAQVSSENLKLIHDLNLLPLPNHRGRIVGASEEKLRSIYDRSAENPVTKLCQVLFYSRKVEEATQGFMKDPGFCFGRAMAAHLEALRQGINKDSIRKIWVVGDFTTRDGNRWRFHAVTIIRGKSREWQVIDPIMDRAISLGEWYDRMRAMDSDGRMKIYSTSAKRLLIVPVDYSKTVLLNDAWGGYFKDLLQYFREEARSFQSPRPSAR